MTDQGREQALRGFRVASTATLLSRVLGMVRDVATAALLGMSGGGVMDAFVIAFRVPNLFRRLFGEGALTASYVPVLTERKQESAKAAWRLVSAAMVVLAGILLGITAVGELVCGVLYFWMGDSEQASLLIRLTAFMLPYVVLVCITAQLGGSLHVEGNFAAPALAPVVLNVLWILAALAAGPLSDDKPTQAFLLTGAILVAGVIQVVMQLAVLWTKGFRFDFNWAESAGDIARIANSMTPAVIGLAITQINTLGDGLIAWGLTAGSDPNATIAWLGGVEAPLQQGAVAATYYGERLYMFPLGLVGIAVATVIFPLLSRHAARGEWKRVGDDLTWGLRLVLLLALPATAGLILLAEPIAFLLFQRGEFTPEDARRTASMIAFYGSGVWAYCSLSVLVRGYYALGDYRTPVIVGAVAVLVNLTLNMLLIWPMAESGLALASATAAALQALALAAIFSRGRSQLAWRELAVSLVRCAVGVAVMTLFGWLTLWMCPDEQGLLWRAVRVFAPTAVCLLVYFGVMWLVGSTELSILARAATRPKSKSPEENQK